MREMNGRQVHFITVTLLSPSLPQPPHYHPSINQMLLPPPSLSHCLFLLPPPFYPSSIASAIHLPLYRSQLHHFFQTPIYFLFLTPTFLSSYQASLPILVARTDINIRWLCYVRTIYLEHGIHQHKNRVGCTGF